MMLYEFKDYLQENKEELLQELLRETYKSKPVLMVEIPKDDGSKRILGIPTVVDSEYIVGVGISPNSNDLGTLKPMLENFL